MFNLLGEAIEAIMVESGETVRQANVEFIERISKKFDLAADIAASVLHVVTNREIAGEDGFASLVLAIAHLHVDGEATLSNLGLSIQEGIGEFRSIVEITDELRVRMTGMSEQQREWIISQAFGAQGAPAIHALVRTPSEEIRHFARAWRFMMFIRSELERDAV